MQKYGSGFDEHLSVEVTRALRQVQRTFCNEHPELVEGCASRLLPIQQIKNIKRKIHEQDLEIGIPLYMIMRFIQCSDKFF